MKTKLVLHTARLFAAACFLTATSAIAGPGSQVMYAPVTAKTSDIQPGSRLAVSCGNCGAVVSIPANRKSYAKGFTCPGCKAKFVRREVGGRGANIPTYVYSDSEGHSATLLRAM